MYTWSRPERIISHDYYVHRDLLNVNALPRNLKTLLHRDLSALLNVNVLLNVNFLLTRLSVLHSNALGPNARLSARPHWESSHLHWESARHYPARLQISHYYPARYYHVLAQNA